MGWALIRGWALINFFCLSHGRLFEVGANSRLGAYSNKYGTYDTSSMVVADVELQLVGLNSFSPCLLTKIIICNY